jgi:antitoxin ParD1/3/4
MRQTINVSIPSDLKQWVDEQAEEGGFTTANDYLLDVLRRARERDARHRLDGTLADAVESGATVVMDDADWASLRKAVRSAAKSPGKKR